MPQSPKDIFKLLKGAALKQHLGHALLLVSSAPAVSVFRDGLSNFIQFLMCTGQTNSHSSLEPCLVCESCKAFAHSKEYEGVHPDFIHVKPESKVGYSVDQIKGIRGRLSLHRSIARERVVIIEEAEDLGASSGGPANALLKLLEEPRPETRLLLISSRPEGILPTIRSRCQTFRIPATVDEVSRGLSQKLESWSPLWLWIERGAASKEWAALPLPANQDSFFKDREEALEELREVFNESWSRAMPLIAALPEHRAREILGWFDDFENCLSSLRSHGQSGLQWSAFKTRAKSRIS